jgi:hypothetical protein
LPPQESQVPWRQDSSGTRDKAPHYGGNIYMGGGADMMDRCVRLTFAETY